jgi:hypothetical protein
MRFNVLVLGFLGCAQGFGAAEYFIAANGNDAWTGKLAAPNSGRTDGPFASLAKAQEAVRSLIKTNPSGPIAVEVRGGTYYLPLSPTSPGILRFSAEDSGTSAMPITWSNYQAETPIVSGGAAIGKGGLGLTWKHVSGSLWQVQLPANTKAFEYLFYNGERRMRSRLQSSSGVGYYMAGGACRSTATKQIVETSLCNLGTFLRVASEVPPTGPNAGCPKVTRAQDATRSKCLDRFGYNPTDPVTNWANLNCSSANAYPVGDVELTLFDSWTVDVMRVSCVDTTNHLIYLSGATKGNPGLINFFGPTVGHRYVIDNAKDAFDAANAAGQTGLWFLDRSTSPWTLNYLANKGENPNDDTVVIGQLEPISTIGGSLFSATNLKYVTLRGITFEVDNFVPGPSGFSDDYNGETTLPEAIECESCQNVIFDAITVRHTSSSGILIASSSATSGPPSTNVTIENSAFYDIGDSGIRIGHHPNGADKPESQVQSVMVRNNVIQGFSRVFPDGEGIAQGGGHHIMYLHNDVSDGYHAGISVCQLGCPSHEANGANVVSQYNHIWNLLQGLTADGGTLYYNIGNASGSGKGNKILNNLVHDVTDSSIIDAGVPGSAYGGLGIYVDNESANIDVENNVVYHLSDGGIQHSDGIAPGESPNTFNNNIFAYARRTMYQLLQPWHQSGCENLTVRDVLTNNIFVFDRDESAKFHVLQGCPYSCGLDYNRFITFQGNLYWRDGGGFATDEKAFRVLRAPPVNVKACSSPQNDNAVNFLTFAQWQAGNMQEDTTGTAFVNPGFGKTGKPTDFILSKNPVPGFDYTKTNDTIRNAGRDHPVIHPTKVPHTFPTYTFTEF